MPKEILDIVDTAVKIGLGALISGVSTYYVTKLNHKSDAVKESTKRTREMIEGVSEEVEVFTNAALEYWAFLVEFTRYRYSDDEAPEDLRAKFLDSGKRLFKDYGKLTSAESKLLLMGFEESEFALRKLGDSVKVMKRRAWDDGSNLSVKEAEGFREEILKNRKEFFSKLRSLYS